MFNYKQLEEEKVEYVEIAPVAELPNGERLFVDIGDTPVVIFNIAGQFFAISDVCSHDDGPVGDGELEGFNIVARVTARNSMCAPGRWYPCLPLSTFLPIRYRCGMG